MLIFLGVINGAFLFPIMLGLFWRRMSTEGAFWATILATVIGYYVYFTVGPLQAVVASGWVSCLVSVAWSLIKPGDFNWQTLVEAGRRKEG